MDNLIDMGIVESTDGDIKFSPDDFANFFGSRGVDTLLVRNSSSGVTYLTVGPIKVSEFRAILEDMRG